MDRGEVTAPSPDRQRNCLIGCSAGLAFAALSVSALILVIALILYNSVQTPVGASTVRSKTVLGSALKTRVGEAKKAGDSVVITGLAGLGNQKHALVSKKLVLRAEYFPFLRYRFDGLNNGQGLYFIWRTARLPRQLFSVPLPRNGRNPSTYNLAQNADWSGTITEIGIHLRGDLRGHPVTIPSLSLEPHGWRNALAAIWSEWTSFRGWTPRSINFLKGTPGPPTQGTWSPALVIAAWAGGAVIVLVVIGCLWRKPGAASYCMAVLIPWISLDLLWQRELGLQLAETRYQFSGKTMREKHLADVDAHIYRYINRLKKNVLPASDSRIFILHDSVGHEFNRLKAQYYLLPHNVYNYGHFPPAQFIRPGDYVLELGEVPELSYDRELNRLSWKQDSLRVEMLDEDPLGRLYRTLPAAESDRRNGSNRGRGGDSG